MSKDDVTQEKETVMSEFLRGNNLSFFFIESDSVWQHPEWPWEVASSLSLISLSSAYCMLFAVLDALHELTHFVLTTILWGGYDFY